MRVPVCVAAILRIDRDVGVGLGTTIGGHGCHSMTKCAHKVVKDVGRDGEGDP